MSFSISGTSNGHLCRNMSAGGTEMDYIEESGPSCTQLYL